MRAGLQVVARRWRRGRVGRAGRGAAPDRRRGDGLRGATPSPAAQVGVLREPRGQRDSGDSTPWGALPAVSRREVQRCTPQRMWLAARANCSDEVPAAARPGEPLQSVALLRAELVAARTRRGDPGGRPRSTPASGSRALTTSDSPVPIWSWAPTASGRRPAKCSTPLRRGRSTPDWSPSSGRSAGPGLPDVEPGTFNMILARGGSVVLYLPAPAAASGGGPRSPRRNPDRPASIGPAGGPPTRTSPRARGRPSPYSPRGTATLPRRHAQPRPCRGPTHQS